MRITLLALSLLTGTLVITNSYTQASNKKITLLESSLTITQGITTDINSIAQNITVRVYADEDKGSGILIAKDNNTYTVITNTHVTDRGETYTIVTPDGIKHQASSVTSNSTENDLALLEFNSNNTYQVATVGNSDNITKGETVIAAGFPENKNELLVTEGKISLITAKPLEKGYSIGFSNQTLQGMSGGALLNSKGEVIAVLGKGNAILDTAYDYMDGTTPTDEEIAAYKKLSFSVPIANIANLSPQLAQLVPSDSNPDIAQQPEAEVPTPEYTGIVKTVDDIARQITVRIDNLEKDTNGSGVIVAKQGNTYYGLTAKHVLCNVVSEPQCEPNGIHQIVTSDGATYQINYQNVEAKQAWLDIAIFSFESNNNYSVATIGAYNPGKSWIFVSGFPKQNTGGDGKPARLITGGWTFPEEIEDFAVKDNYSLAISKAQGQNGLLYTNISYGGMSGGAVLDSEGRLIGIHTGSENEVYENETGNYDEYSLGFSLGETITDFLGHLQTNKSNLNEVWLSKSQKKASSLSKDEINSIETQLLTAKQPEDQTNLVAWMNYGNRLWRYGKLNESVNAFNQVIEINPEFHQAYYMMGLAYFYQQDWHKAAEAFEKASQINPNSYFYWRYLGTSYQQLDRYDEAISAFEQAIAKNPEDFILYLAYGEVLNNTKQYLEAISKFNLAIELNPKHPFIYRSRGNIYYEQGQPSLALADYNQALQLNSNYFDAYNNRGLIYSNIGKTDLALADYNKAIEIDSNDAGIYVNRGALYYEQEKNDLALADYNQAIKLDPQFALAYNNRGIVYYEQEKTDLALADFEQAIKLDPQSALAYNNRGALYYEQEKTDLALADFEQAIKLDPQSALAYGNRGNLYYKQGKKELAIAEYNQAIKLDPQSALAYGNRGNLYYEQGKIDLALADLDRAIKFGINEAKVYYNRGLIYQNQGKSELAIADYSKAISIDPQFTLAYNNRGIVYQQQGKIDLAQADFDRAIQKNSELALVYFNQGNLYLQQGKIEEALTNFNQAIELNPQFIDAYYNRGNLYTRQGKPELAISDFKEVVKLDSNYAQAYAGLGLAYIQLSNAEKARINLQKAQQLFIAQNNSEGAKAMAVLLDKLNSFEDRANQPSSNNDAQSYYNRALINHRQGKLDLALADYNKAIELNPLLVDAYNNRGIIYKDRGKIDLALADYNKAIQIKPNYANAYYNRGYLYVLQEKADLAIADYSKAIEINPQLAQAYSDRGFIYYKLKENQLALADLKQAIEINPNLAISYENLGLVYIELKNFEEARANLQKAQQLHVSQGNTASAEKVAGVIRLLP